MSPELFDWKKFGLKDGRPTKHSDCYALGMVIHEVLSGQVPFSRHADYVVVVRVLKGKRPGRPQGDARAWFLDDVRNILEHCWKPRPGDRPSIEDVLQRLEGVSRSWTPPCRTVPNSPIENSPARDSDSCTEESVDESEAPSPSQTVSSQQSQELPLKGDVNESCA